jgi:hypothetical protein
MPNRHDASSSSGRGVWSEAQRALATAREQKHTLKEDPPLRSPGTRRKRRAAERRQVVLAAQRECLRDGQPGARRLTGKLDLLPAAQGPHAATAAEARAGAGQALRRLSVTHGVALHAWPSSAELSIAASARRCRSVIDPTVLFSDMGSRASSLRQRV